MLVMGIGLSVMMNARLALVFIVCAPVLALIMFFIVRSVAPRYSVLQRAVVSSTPSCRRTSRPYAR